MNKPWWKNAGIWLAVFVGIAVLFYFLGVVGFRALVPDVEERGQWGDSFGVVTALFTVLAFIGLLWTIHQNSKQLSQNSEQLLQNSEQIAVQQKELEVQIEELRQTREEMAEQTKQFVAQNSTLQTQSFENSLFQLLGLYTDTVKSLEFPLAGNKKASGYEFFRHVLMAFSNCYNSSKRKSIEEFLVLKEGIDKSEILELLENDGLGTWVKWHEQEEGVDNMLRYINEEYEKFFTKNHQYVGHYLRYLYNLFMFVDESDLIDESQKKRYTDLIHLQLLRNEMVFLFYACLSQREADFKRLIEKYAVFEDIDFAELLNDRHWILYEKSAFGSRLNDDKDSGA